MKLSAGKPSKINAAAPSPKKGLIKLIDVADILAMPNVDNLGIACIDDFDLKPTAEFQYLYLTPSTQKYEINPDGDADSRLFRKKIFGSYPGSHLEIFEFIKENINRSFVAVYKECDSEYSKIFGSIYNPLFISPNYKDDSESKTYEITLEQNDSDDVPILFYNGGEPVIVDDGILEIVDLTGIPYSGSYKPKKIYLVSAGPTEEELEFFNFPVIFRIIENGFSTDITYDRFGNRFLDRTEMGSDKVIQIGSITATTSSITLGLHTSGFNTVRISGQILSRNVEQIFTFPTVTQEEIFQIYAINDMDVFHLALPGEEIPEGALIVAFITISEDGISISNKTYKLKEESNWQNIAIKSNASPVILDQPSDVRGSFYLTKSLGVGEITIEAIKRLSSGTVAKDYMYGGRELLLFNATGGNIIIDSSGATDPDSYFFSNRITPFTLKNDTGILVKLRGDVLELLPSGSDPDLTPYALDVDLDTEKNRNDTQDLAITALQTQHYKTISGNVTIDDTYYNCIWKITANAIITVPSTLRADFIAGFEVIGSFAGTFTEGSGVTFSAPFGKVCTADSSGIIYKDGSETFRLKTT